MRGLPQRNIQLPKIIPLSSHSWVHFSIWIIGNNRVSVKGKLFKLDGGSSSDKRRKNKDGALKIWYCLFEVFAGLSLCAVWVIKHLHTRWCSPGCYGVKLVQNRAERPVNWPGRHCLNLNLSGPKRCTFFNCPDTKKHKIRESELTLRSQSQRESNLNIYRGLSRHASSQLPPEEQAERHSFREKWTNGVLCWSERWVSVHNLWRCGAHRWKSPFYSVNKACTCECAAPSVPLQGFKHQRTHTKKNARASIMI